MEICSVPFLILIGGLLILYYGLPAKARGFQKWVLLAASFGFYASFGLKPLIYAAVTAASCYGAGLLIWKAPAQKKLWVALDLIVTLGLLLLLKYRGFFNHVFLRGVPGIADRWPGLARNLVLPVGISFYTLTALGYTLDVARGKIPAEGNFFRFLLFVFYFPHILQGPIARYDRLAPQLRAEHGFDWTGFVRGLERMLWGYFKKLVIADRAAILVDAVYTHAAVRGGTELFLASLLYTLEIYADFSGCVDILGGVSELFGVSLDPNFREPYLARSLNEFWRRWHISLSTWFRDYVYIPLGGNRKGAARRWANLLAVFLISGFWHGAGWNFIIWGAFHGMFQLLEDLFYRKVLKCRPDEVPQKFMWLQQLVTFHAVSLAWIFFRVPSLRTALKIIRAILLRPSLWILGGEMFSFGLDAPELLVLLAATLLLFAVDTMNSRGVSGRDVLAGQPAAVRWLTLLAGLAATLVFGVYGLEFNAGTFIYMQF